MQEKLNIQLPSQGWKQILTARTGMLNEYDRAREQARSHEVETYHGRVAESACRKWLGGFLPKRDGVTSGYVVSPGLGSGDKTPHFDVIIYDQLESPILWIEDNADTSSQGESRAIPVEHVRAILEVKSTFSAKTVRAALKHLRDLSPLLGHVDSPTDAYKLHLPPTFCCGLLFFELREVEAKSDESLSALIESNDIRGYVGGAILRAEGHTLPQTGRLCLAQLANPFEGTTALGTCQLDVGLSASVPLAENVHIATKLAWSESGFAEFAFDLVAMVQGTYEPGRLSSLYGIGGRFAEMVRELGITVSPFKKPPAG
jgi:hypothetical protein